MVSRIRYRDCRRLFGGALVAWQAMVVDLVDGDVSVARGTLGIDFDACSNVAPSRLASKRVGKV